MKTGIPCISETNIMLMWSRFWAQLIQASTEQLTLHNNHHHAVFSAPQNRQVLPGILNHYHLFICPAENGWPATNFIVFLNYAGSPPLRNPWTKLKKSIWNCRTDSRACLVKPCSELAAWWCLCLQRDCQGTHAPPRCSSAPPCWASTPLSWASPVPWHWNNEFIAQLEMKLSISTPVLDFTWVSPEPSPPELLMLLLAPLPPAASTTPRRRHCILENVE